MARSCSCNDFNRSPLLRRGAARRREGAAEHRAGDANARRHGSDRRTFLLASAGAALSVYGASMLCPRHSKRASPRPRPPPAPTSRCSSRSSWKAAGTRCRCWRRSRKRKYKELRPTLGLAEGSGQAFTEDEKLMWHPSATGLAELHEEGKVTAFPAIGYEPQDESHFTSRHYWEVGELDTNTRTGWMGRYLDVAGEPTTRCRASPWTTRSRRRSPPRRCPSPLSPRPPTTRCGRRAWRTGDRTGP